MDISKSAFVLILFVHVYGRTHRRLLTQSLLQSYDKITCPEGSPLNVTHTLQLKRIVSLENQVLSLDAYISLQWQDDQLMWNPDEFGGITLIRIPSHMLWQPDIMLEDNAEKFNGVHSGDINMVIAYDGVVFYIPPVKVKSYCSVDHSKLKRNDQVTCTLKFLSWTYDGLSLNLEAGPEGSILSDFDKSFSKDWRLVDASVKRNVRSYPCCPEPYIDIAYKLILRKL